MIPAPFEYVRVGSVDEAVDALSEHGEEATLLAGGHSLLPLMRLRLAVPEVLVDLGRVDELRGVRDAGDHLAVGAMTTHHQVMSDPLVREHCGVLAEVTGEVGDPQVRHRGTIGGACAHGDAAGDHPACLLALDATMVARDPGGTREITAADFFTGIFETALAPDEVLTEVHLPKLDGSWGFDYQKFQRVKQAWAIVGACALVRREDGRIGEARVGLTNLGSVPVRATGTERLLAGAAAEPDALREAAAQAAEGTQPPTDSNARPDYRRHLARVLTLRALQNSLAS
ncbi:MAG: xanthine dehydrogenase family protein subunit M [Actinobacteria bacterium]|nr:xanthine dehydrogenase family protein subunit M [Actinomycetota bacterium]